jgi:hypothetical protein
MWYRCIVARLSCAILNLRRLLELSTHSTRNLLRIRRERGGAAAGHQKSCMSPLGAV